MTAVTLFLLFVNRPDADYIPARKEKVIIAVESMDSPTAEVFTEPFTSLSPNLSIAGWKLKHELTRRQVGLFYSFDVEIVTRDELLLDPKRSSSGEYPRWKLGKYGDWHVIPKMSRYHNLEYFSALASDLYHQERVDAWKIYCHKLVAAEVYGDWVWDEPDIRYLWVDGVEYTQVLPPKPVKRPYPHFVEPPKGNLFGRD